MPRNSMNSGFVDTAIRGTLPLETVKVCHSYAISSAALQSLPLFVLQSHILFCNVSVHQLRSPFSIST